VTFASDFFFLNITIDHECTGAIITPLKVSSLSYTILSGKTLYQLNSFDLLPTSLSCYNIALLENNK